MRNLVSLNLVYFGRKMVRNAAHNAFLNTLTVGTPFSRVPRQLFDNETAYQRVPRKNDPRLNPH